MQVRKRRPRRLRLRASSRQPGRVDFALTVYRNWHGGGPLDPSVRHFVVYVAFLPVVRLRRPVHGRHWHSGWIWGRRGAGRNLHLGPVGFWWT